MQIMRCLSTGAAARRVMTSSRRTSGHHFVLAQLANRNYQPQCQSLWPSKRDSSLTEGLGRDTPADISEISRVPLVPEDGQPICKMQRRLLQMPQQK